MATRDDMVTRIKAEILRPDLGSQILDAILDAIAIYQKERFRFSDINPAVPPTFNTVLARDVYTSADNANISTAHAIDYVLINIGGTVSYLDPASPLDLKLSNQLSTMRGPPDQYAYEGNSLILSPVPDQAYLITLGLFQNVAAPAAGNTPDNAWMNEAEQLIRARAKYIIAKNITRNAAMAEAQSPDAPELNNGKVGEAYRAWKMLKGDANRITSRKRVRAMQF